MFGALFKLVTRVGLPQFLEQRKMIFFLLILWHRTVVYVTETSSKMKLTLSPKWSIIFFPKRLKILYISRRTIFFKFHQHVVQTFIK